jgi:hypothetical protein
MDESKFEQKYLEYKQFIYRIFNLTDDEYEILKYNHMNSIEFITQKKTRKRYRIGKGCDELNKYINLLLEFFRTFYEKNEAGIIVRKVFNASLYKKYIKYDDMNKHIEKYKIEYTDHFDAVIKPEYIEQLKTSIKLLNVDDSRFSYFKLLQKISNDTKLKRQSVKNSLLQKIRNKKDKNMKNTLTKFQRLNNVELSVEELSPYLEIIQKGLGYDTQKYIEDKLFYLKAVVTECCIKLFSFLLRDNTTVMERINKLKLKLIKDFQNDQNKIIDIDEKYTEIIEGIPINQQIGINIKKLIFNIILMVKYYVKRDLEESHIVYLIECYRGIYSENEEITIKLLTDIESCSQVELDFDNIQKLNNLILKYIEVIQEKNPKTQFEYDTLFCLGKKNIQAFNFTLLQKEYLKKSNQSTINQALMIECLNQSKLYVKCKSYLKGEINEDINIVNFMLKNNDILNMFILFDVFDDSLIKYLNQAFFNLDNKVLNSIHYINKIFERRIRILWISNNIEEFKNNLISELVNIFKEHTITNSILSNYPLPGFDINHCIQKYSDHHIFFQEFLCSYIFISDFNKLDDSFENRGDPISGNSGNPAQGMKGKLYINLSDCNKAIKNCYRDKGDKILYEYFKDFLLSKMSESNSNELLKRSIINVYELYIGYNNLYITMDLIHSNTFNKPIINQSVCNSPKTIFLKKGKLLIEIFNDITYIKLNEIIKIKIIIKIFIKIFEILDLFQGKYGLIHGDLNLYNIMIDFEYIIYNTNIIDITVNNVYIIDFELASFILNRNVCILYNNKQNNYSDFFYNYKRNNHWKIIDTFFILYTLIYRLYPRLKYTLTKNITNYFSNLLSIRNSNGKIIEKIPFNKSNNKHVVLCISSIIPDIFKNYVSNNIFFINSNIDVQKNSLKYISNPLILKYSRNLLIVYSFFNLSFKYEFYMNLYDDKKITECNILPSKSEIILNSKNMKKIINEHKLNISVTNLLTIYKKNNKKNHKFEGTLLDKYTKKKEADSNYAREVKSGTSKIIAKIIENFQPTTLIETFNKFLLELTTKPENILLKEVIINNSFEKRSSNLPQPLHIVNGVK